MGKAEDAGNEPSGRKLSVKIRKLRKIENQMAG